LHKHQTVQNTYARNKGICEQTRIQTYIYQYPCFSSIIVTFGSLLGNCMFYVVCCLSNNKDYVSQLIHFTGLHFSFVSLVLSSFHYKKQNTSHFTSLHSSLLLICQLVA
jgi:hypothetical protein